jgi:hypothetical protein
MSTISKLDPSVKRARLARRELLAFFGDVVRRARRLPVGADKRPEVADFAVRALGVLTEVYSSSRMTGEAKNQVFSRVAHEWRAMFPSQAT